jgi:hypothetical protein
LSDGQFHPLIRPISKNREELIANPFVNHFANHFLHNLANPIHPVQPLTPVSRIDTEEDIYNRETSDLEWPEDPDEPKQQEESEQQQQPDRVHLGYVPITEEEAFQHPVSENTLQASRFTLPRGQMSADQIIDHIRKVVLATRDINEIAPKDTHPGSEQDRILYSSTLLYTTFDQYGNHRFAEFNVRLQPVKDQDAESIAVIATHFQGDTRLSMALFLTLRASVLSNGTADQKVRTPELFHGFSDEYLDDMTEPDPITIFAEVYEDV